MQIFATSPDPREAAESLRHDVKRRWKMILEASQLLSTAVWHLFYQDLAPMNWLNAKDTPKSFRKEISKKRKESYKKLSNFHLPTHENNKLVMWLLESKENSEWLKEYAMTLQEIRLEEGDKGGHTTMMKILSANMMIQRHYKIARKQTPFVNCTPYKDMPTFEAYKKLLLEKQS